MKFYIPSKLKSRKFLVAIISGLIIGLNDAFDWGLDKATQDAIVKLAAAYIFGEAVVDFSKAKNKK